MKTKKNLFTHLNIQMAAFFLAANFIFLLICSALYYQWAFQILLENSEKLHIQSIQQTQHRIEQTLDEADRAVNLLSYGNTGQKILAHSGSETDIDSILLFRNYLEQVSGILRSYSSIYSIYFYTGDNLLIGASPLHTCINDEPASVSPILEYAGTDNSWNVIGGLKEDFFNPLFNKEEKNPRLVTMIRRSPVFHSSTVYGYIIVNFQEERFYDAFQAELPGEELLLLTSDGMIISGSRKDRIGEIDDGFLSSKTSNTSRLTYDKHVPVLNLCIPVSNTGLFLVNRIRLEELIAGRRDIIWKIMVTLVLESLCMLPVVSLWLRIKLHPVKELTEKMDEIKNGRFTPPLKKIPENELGILVESFNQMSLSIVELMDKNEQIYRQKTQQELQALRAQLNPHFIYNTLNTIKWMAVMENADNITECITALGCLLEPIFKSDGQLWKAENEIDYLQNYIKIMGWRYGSTCSFCCHIMDTCTDMLIPRFILQPIVENSTTHGIRKDKSIQIDITCREENKCLLLCVHDNGSISPDRLQHILLSLDSPSPAPSLGVGLFNVNRRIKLNFGEEYGLHITSSHGHGTLVTLTLPIITKEEPYETS